MFAVNQMKFAPFGGGKRAKDGMVRHRFTTAEAGFAFLNHAVHADDISQNFSRHLFGERAARSYPRRRLAPARKVSRVNQDQTLPTFATSIRSGTWRTGLQAAFETLDGAGISQIQVFENLRRA